MDLESELRDRSSAGSCNEWHTQRFDLSDSRDRAALAELLGSGSVAAVHDTIIAQLHELIRLHEPSRTFDAAELDARLHEHLAGRAPHQYGSWVHYPWTSRLVHVLPDADV